MKKFLIPLATIAALGFAGHTNAMPTQVQPIVEVQADCSSGLTINTSGYPEGASGMFTIGSEAPRRLALNGSVHADWPVSIDVFDYVVMAVPGDGQTVTGTVNCHVEVATNETPEQPMVVEIGTALAPEPVVVEPVMVDIEWSATNPAGALW